MISQGAGLDNRNSVKFFDEQKLKHGGYMGLIEAHDKHLNLNREFVKILEGTAISGN